MATIATAPALDERESQKTARLSVRSTEEQKGLIERAAALLGESMTSFLLSTALRDATNVIHQHQVTRLSVRDWELFERIVDQGVEPNDMLREAAARYEDVVTSSEGL